MPQTRPVVGILFELESCETVFGESVYVVGERRELGQWRVPPSACNSMQLRTDADVYPRWTALCPLWIRLEEHELGNNRLRVQYKYVIGKTPSNGCAPRWLKWERAIEDRVVDLPAVHGSVWLVTDQGWNCMRLDADAAPVPKCLTVQDIHARWREFRGLGLPSAETMELLLNPRDPEEEGNDRSPFEANLERQLNALTPQKAFYYKSATDLSRVRSDDAATAAPSEARSLSNSSGWFGTTRDHSLAGSYVGLSDFFGAVNQEDSEACDELGEDAAQEDSEEDEGPSFMAISIALC
uniref:CBM20 domain-containing protein n=1 Tax=Zooxanthella nutricula TaxID=1333877 RepID=A0A6U6H103_9DINO|mmetsp:Transcript_11204/g.33204  ORF Transcript_11204/g.33204 Transcript_11204/m.33204 type:complete len:296 (+) Transcript_11204:71-958(+)